MQASNGSPLSYEDFEPFCNWRRDDESVTLVVHIPEFKREQLKIQVNHTTNTVKISGERLVDATKRSRFYKEITIPKDCKSTEVHAKLIGDLFHVIMPKKITPSPPQQEPSTANPQIQQPEASKQSTPNNISQQQATKLPALPEPDNAEQKTLSKNVAVLEKDDTQLCNLSSSKGLLKTARNVAAVVAVAAALVAYIMYSYRHLYIDQD